MTKRFQSIMVSFALALPFSTFATELQQLPSSARKLSGKEIVELQNGAKLTFEDYTADAVITGTTTHDFVNSRQNGIYEYRGSHGNFAGKVWIKDDMFCHAEDGRGNEICGFVYLDGNTFYTVGVDGKILAIDKKE